jgi:hypothetical protein
LLVSLQQRPILNLGPYGQTLTPGVNFVPWGEVIPWDEIICSPLHSSKQQRVFTSVNKGDKFNPWWTSSLKFLRMQNF